MASRLSDSLTWLRHFLLTSPEMALIHPEQVQITGNHNVQPRSVLGSFCGGSGTASCAFRSTNAAGRSNRFRGWSRRRCAARCRITLKWKSSSARPSHFCATAARWPGRCAWRDSRPAAEGEVSFSRGERNQRGDAASKSASGACSFLPDFMPADSSRACGRDGTSERSGSFGRARFARHVDGTAGRKRSWRVDEWRLGTNGGAVPGAFWRQRF